MQQIALYLAFVASLPSPDPPGKEYKSDEWTQSIDKLLTGGFLQPRVQFVKIADLEFDWNHSGGLNSSMEFTSRKFKSGGKPVYKMAPISVSFQHMGQTLFQEENGLTRAYPNGARFDDVLFNKEGQVFEHRVREKKEGRWTSRVEYKNIESRPKGYTGLKRSCASCHDQAGTGGYGVGLVPGGDTVISDPMDWGTIGK